MENEADRILQITDTLNAPIELVWQVWTIADHVANWWGPNGFTNTISVMDVNEGGEWRLTMHGPNGTDYANRSIFKEIVPLKKIVFEHYNPHFMATVLFEPYGDKTHLSWTMLFDTPEMYETIVKVHKADEGQKQNVEKLKRYLDKMREE
jgi:uncharacterized protein YndB with AHSA1/START domain